MWLLNLALEKILTREKQNSRRNNTGVLYVAGLSEKLKILSKHHIRGASDPATASDKIWFIPRTKYTNKLNNKTYAVQESLGLYIETAPQSKTEL